MLSIPNEISDLEYFLHATDNEVKVTNCPDGATCVYCLNTFPYGQEYKCFPGELTVICPHCFVDAVVPNSSFSDEKTLIKWHRLGFKTYKSKDGTLRDIDTDQICDPDGNICFLCPQ